MNAVRGLLPHPVLSLALLVIWLTLNETVQPGHILLGAALGVGLPLLSKPTGLSGRRFTACRCSGGFTTSITSTLTST